MSRGKSIYHYATKSDYKSFFDQLAQVIELKFVLDIDRTDSNFEIFNNPLKWPEFGVSKWRNGVARRFIVLNSDAVIPFEYRPQREVPEKYGFFVPSPNYWHVYFDISQFYKENDITKGLLQGCISTNSANSESMMIFDAMKKIIRRQWHSVPHAQVYLGPEALAFLRSGGRLNEDLTRPIEFDLREQSPTPGLKS
jgi:hypothetical protein